MKQKLNKMQTVSERESFIFEPIMTVLQKELGSCVTVDRAGRGGVSEVGGSGRGIKVHRDIMLQATFTWPTALDCLPHSFVLTETV